jgi:hypothetical protein
MAIANIVLVDVVDVNSFGVESTDCSWKVLKKHHCGLNTPSREKCHKVTQELSGKVIHESMRIFGDY